MKLTCTKDPSHKRFYATAHVAETWTTDEHGDWIESGEVTDTVHAPDAEDMWQCVCGSDVEVEQ